MVSCSSSVSRSLSRASRSTWSSDPGRPPKDGAPSCVTIHRTSQPWNPRSRKAPGNDKGYPAYRFRHRSIPDGDGPLVKNPHKVNSATTAKIRPAIKGNVFCPSRINCIAGEPWSEWRPTQAPFFLSSTQMNCRNGPPHSFAYCWMQLPRLLPGLPQGELCHQC